jgi:hypothetical protein
MCLTILPSNLPAASPSPDSSITPKLPEVTWFRAYQDLGAEDFVELKCGSLGSYYVAAGEIGYCPAPTKSKAGVECRVDQLSYYTQEATPFLYQSGLFDEPGPEPAIALIDWLDGHGTAMATTIKQLSDLNVVLYDLGAHIGVGDLGLSGVTDIHVVKVLCSLLEDAEQPRNQSLIFNMSWGRPGYDGVYNACSEAEAANRLAGEIKVIIDHLSSLPAGDPIYGNTMTGVAAAGNHGDPSQFPACLNRVMSVAAIDVAELAATRKVDVSWESPTKYNALSPGTGLCFYGKTDKNIMIPNGTSAASAFFAALLGQALLSSSIPDPTQGLWYTDPYYPYFLVQTSFPVGEPEAERSYAIGRPAYHDLMDRLLGETAETCLPTGFAGHVPADSIITLEHEFGAELLPALSLPEAFVEMSLPSPTSMPCGACPGDDTGGGGGGLLPLDEIGEVEGIIPAVNRLVIDLSGGVQLPAELKMSKVFLRIGDSFMGPDSHNQVLLDRLSSGSLDYIAFDNFGLNNYWDSVSLVMILTCPGCDDPSREFWSATAVRVIR